MGFTLSLFAGLLEQKCHFKLKCNFSFQKSFDIDEEWHLFYDSTLSGWVIQDFDLCKLHDLWHHKVDTKMMLNQKMECLWRSESILRVKSEPESCLSPSQSFF